MNEVSLIETKLVAEIAEAVWHLFLSEIAPTRNHHHHHHHHHSLLPACLLDSLPQFSPTTNPPPPPQTSTLSSFSRRQGKEDKQMKQKSTHTVTGFTLTQGGGGGIADTPQPTMAVRFLGPLKPPDPNPNPTPFELDEIDVVWSDLTTDDAVVVSRSPPTTASTSPTTPRLHNTHHQIHPLKSGLSAALSDDLLPLVRRKPTLNPSLSAASAARTIPPVPAATSPARFPQSAPVNVPVWPKMTHLGRFEEVVDEEEGEGEEEIVPPHEIVARSHVMTFSVFEGAGRTLKGRDLRRVRNAVFQKTGFID